MGQIDDMRKGVRKQVGKERFYADGRIHKFQELLSQPGLKLTCIPLLFQLLNHVIASSLKIQTYVHSQNYSTYSYTLLIELFTDLTLLQRKK